MPATGSAPSTRKTTPNGVTANGLSPPVGTGWLGRDHVADIQRARLFAAMVDIAAEGGLADATVAAVVARAGVSRRTFYELFADREQCFLAALDDAISRATEAVVPAYRAGEGWVERVRLALAALLAFLDVERGAGRLLIVGSLGAGPEVLERRTRLLATLAAIVDEARAESKAAHSPPPLTAEGVVGGALSIVHARITAGVYPLAELQSALMSMIVLPYLGSAAARRELSRPTPTPTATKPPVVADPLRDLDMRLTYRTVRVLLGVGAKPGSSNREVGLAAGITDQGQVSKLLKRLQRIGLLENHGGPQDKGAPNAWRLTAKGRDVERAMATE